MFRLFKNRSSNAAIQYSGGGTACLLAASRQRETGRLTGYVQIHSPQPSSLPPERRAAQLAVQRRQGCPRPGVGIVHVLRHQAHHAAAGVTQRRARRKEEA